MIIALLLLLSGAVYAASSMVLQPADYVFVTCAGKHTPVVTRIGDGVQVSCRPAPAYPSAVHGVYLPVVARDS